MLEAAGRSKKSPLVVATERDEEASGDFGSGLLPASMPGGWYSSTRAGFTPPCDAPEGQGSERREGIRQGSQEPGKEYYPDRIHHPPRSHGCLYDDRGRHRRQSLLEAYIEHFLAPTLDLEEGQVVILDGLGAHRTDRVRELVEATGADLLFLPPYSPDLNPIEEAFSKVKNIVRKAQARTKRWLRRSP